MEARVKPASKQATTYQEASRFKEALYRVFAATAQAILVVLGGGLLLATIGNLSGIHALSLVGSEAQALLAPAIGGGSLTIKHEYLGNFASLVSATVGANAALTSASVNAATRLAKPAFHWLEPHHHF